jgi:hypothetical protein
MKKTAPALTSPPPLITSPYRFEEQWSDDDFATIGRLAMRWALTEHILKNCLRVKLGLPLEEANLMIYPLSMETVLQKIDGLQKISRYRESCQDLLRTKTNN